MRFSPGQNYGPYELVSPLGAGGMGEVWKARDTRLHRVVALKFPSAAFTDRAQREAQTIASLNHPNIATLYDVGPDYFVMEYVEGTPLRPTEDTRKLLDLAAQIADGLAAAHAAGIVHRDLKPDNILVTKTGRVKILDFGLARQSAASADATEAITLTQPGTVVGTVAYMSPEQARGQELDARSDQFSFGLILYELATGQRAFARETAPELMAAIIREPAPALPEQLPAPLRWTIDRCLAKDPADRYAGTRDLYLELRGMEGRLTQASRPADRPKRRTWLWAVACAAVPLLALLLWQLQASWRPDISRYRIVPFANEDYPEEHPSWSPDGRSIAYVSQTPDAYEVVVKDLDGSPPVVLAKSRNPIENLSWSADGSRIYYTPWGGVFWVGRAGGTPAQVAMFHRVYSSAVSPDGRSLAALETDAPENPGKRLLYIASPPEAAPRPVPGFAGACCFAPDSLAWSPDSSRLLVGFPTQHGQEIWLVNAKGGSRRLFESMGRWSADFSWLPGNRYAVISTDDDPGLHLLDTANGEMSSFLPSPTASEPSVAPGSGRIAFAQGARRFSMIEIPLNGGPPHPLLRSRLTLQYPNWARTSNQFLYVRGEEIVLHDRTSDSERVLISRRSFPETKGPIEFIEPMFSSDEKRITFNVRTAEGVGAWIVHTSGGVPVRLVAGTGQTSPTWSPDGNWLAYLTRKADGKPVVRKIRLGGGSQPVDLADYNCRPNWSPTGEWILCMVNPPSLAPRLISPDGKEVRELPRELTRPATWTHDGQAIYSVRGFTGEVEKFDLKTGAMTVVSHLPVTLRFNSRSGGGLQLSLSPDGKSLAGTVAASDGDIWILDGFEPPHFWDRLWR